MNQKRWGIHIKTRSVRMFRQFTDEEMCVHIEELPALIQELASAYAAASGDHLIILASQGCRMDHDLEWVPKSEKDS
ncbi:hypothetical protein KFU94_38205 [Chloroflexi bacterium TSY]|nr:hypothetical protein [Chloroflexi bacterium TSY]